MGQSVGCCTDRERNFTKRPVTRGKHQPGKDGKLSFVGRGGVSRLIMENGPDGHEELQKFMAKGSTIERATIYSQDDPAESPDPMQAIDFWNIGGAKVYSYSGLYLNEIPSDTAVGVLMLDRYAIQERPGDPANPCTFWPYQAFYSIPAGVDFAMCKKVGSAGAEAGTTCRDEVGTIVNALAGLAEVALAQGKKRVIVTADCGYYALALPAYAEGLLTREGWVQGADAAFNCPSFRVKDELDLILTLGTTQLISSPDPTKNLVSRMDDCAIVYGTADLMGWYGGSVLDKIKAEYPEPDSFAHVVCANKGLTWGMMLADCSSAEEAWVWSEVSAQLVEYVDTSISFIIGMYIGYKVDEDTGIRSEEHQAKIDKQDTGLEGGQTIYEGWGQLPVAGKILLQQLVDDPSPIIKFIAPALRHVEEKALERTEGPRGDIRGAQADQDGQDDTDHFKALVFLVGRLNKDAGDDSAEEMDQQTRLRVTENAKKILNFNEGKDEIGKDGVHLRKNEVTLGPRFVSWYCQFQVRINTTVLKDSFEAGQVGHAVDGQKVFLFDCKFVPGFGKMVADGLTVWTHASHYFWVSAMYGHYAEILQEQLGGAPIAYNMECTELFSFTNFLQQNGVPTVDNINLMYIASKASGDPLKYRRYDGHSAPAAMLTDAGMSRWFRRKTLPLRTPDYDLEDYIDTREYVFPGKAADRKKMGSSPTVKTEIWDKLVKPEFHFGGKAMSIGRNQNLYVESCELCTNYLANQYKPGEGQWRGKIDLSA